MNRFLAPLRKFESGAYQNSLDNKKAYSRVRFSQSKMVPQPASRSDTQEEETIYPCYFSAVNIRIYKWTARQAETCYNYLARFISSVRSVSGCRLSRQVRGQSSDYVHSPSRSNLDPPALAGSGHRCTRSKPRRAPKHCSCRPSFRDSSGLCRDSINTSQ